MSEEKEQYFNSIKEYSIPFDDDSDYERYIWYRKDSFLARWNGLLRAFASDMPKEETICIGDKRYPLMLADEVLHLRSLSFDTLDFVETLIDVWMARQSSARDGTRGCQSRGVSKSRVAIKVDDVSNYIQDCAQKVLEIQNFNTAYMTDEGKEQTFWLIHEISLDWEDGEYYVKYAVDWDIARLGFPEQYGEIAEAWDSLKLRDECGSYDVMCLKHFHNELHSRKARAEYDKWAEKHPDEDKEEEWNFRGWLSHPARTNRLGAKRLWTVNTLNLYPGYGYYKGDEK